MLKRFKSNIYSDFPSIENTEVFLAISGGRDSMALSHLLRALNIKHTLLHCNFQLRNEESSDDEEFLLKYAEKFDLKILVKKFDTAGIAIKFNNNIQLTARELRYSWFKDICPNNGLLMTAHHQDDSIETFFINLMRGTGLKGATGIPKNNENIYRPLHNFSGDEINQYVIDNGIEFREDSSNSSLLYRRNKIRHELIPLIESISPNSSKKIASFLSENDKIQNYIEKNALKSFEAIIQTHREYLEIPLNKIDAIDTVLIQTFFSKYGIKRSNFNEFIKFLGAKTGSKFISKSHVYFIDRGKLLFKKNEAELPPRKWIIESLPFVLEDVLSLNLNKIENLTELMNPNFQMVDISKISFPIMLRNHSNGDKIIPLGMSESKLVSDILINKKINPIQKGEILVLEDSSNELIALIGICISDSFKLTSFSEDVLIIGV